MAEARDLKSLKCRFESDGGYMAKVTLELDEDTALAFYQAMTRDRGVEGYASPAFHFILGYNETGGNYAEKKYTVHPKNLTLELKQ